MLSVDYVSDLQLIDNSSNQEPLETELLAQVEYDMDEQGVPPSPQPSAPADPYA